MRDQTLEWAIAAASASSALAERATTVLRAAPPFDPETMTAEVADWLARYGNGVLN